MLNSLMFWKSAPAKAAQVVLKPVSANGIDPNSPEMRARLLILAMKNGQTRVLRPN